jgi:hypothetical protein
MTTIKDPDFVRAVYRRFCLRPVSDPDSRKAIQTRRIEVQPRAGGVLVISICDRQGSLIDIGWDGTSAWAMRVHPFDEALLNADERALSRLVGRFLQGHGVIEQSGIPVKRGVA